MDRDGLGGFELLILAIGGIAALAVAVAWTGAALALLVVGNPAAVPLSDAVDALGRLPGHLADPAAAWPPTVDLRLPGPIVYWSCTAAASLAAIALAAGAIRVARNASRVGSLPRRPLGVDGRARFATRRDLAPILVRGPRPGRFVVGRHGRHLVATEAPSRTGRRARRWRPVRRRGDRGAGALIGPPRPRKTTPAV